MKDRQSKLPLTEHIVSESRLVLNMKPEDRRNYSHKDSLMTAMMKTFFNITSDDDLIDALAIPIKKSVTNIDDMIVMLSGGAGSLATLWKALSSGKNPGLLYFGGVYEGTTLAKREAAIETIALGSRNSEGSPLATPPDWTTWLSTVELDSPIADLPRKAKMGIMIASAKEAVGSEGELPVLAWGPINGLETVLKVMEPWGFTHLCPFDDYEEALSCLADGEVISDALHERHGGKELFKLSAGAMLPPSCTDIVCSCWRSEDVEDVPSPHYFQTMCNQCDGCQRWYSALDKVRMECPHLWVGSKAESSPGETEWKTLPTLQQEKRIQFNSIAVIKSKKKLSSVIPLCEEEYEAEEDDADRNEDSDTDGDERISDDDDEPDMDVDMEEDIDLALDDDPLIEDYTFDVSDVESDYEPTKKRKKRS